MEGGLRSHVMCTRRLERVREVLANGGKYLLASVVLGVRLHA